MPWRLLLVTYGAEMTVCVPGMPLAAPDHGIAGSEWALDKEHKYAAECLVRDLELRALIEKYEIVLSGAEVLVDAVSLLMFARAACSTGDVANGVVIYKSAVRDFKAAVESQLRAP